MCWVSKPFTYHCVERWHDNNIVCFRKSLFATRSVLFIQDTKKNIMSYYKSQNLRIVFSVYQKSPIGAKMLESKTKTNFDRTDSLCIVSQVPFIGLRNRHNLTGYATKEKTSVPVKFQRPKLIEMNHKCKNMKHTYISSQ